MPAREERRSWSAQLRLRRHRLFALLAAPAVALAYAVLAYGIHAIGCLPPFEDVDFFGVRVTDFLLLALTATALVLVVLAVAPEQEPGPIKGDRRAPEPFLVRVVLALTLAALAFGAVLWVAVEVWRMGCG